MTVSWLRLERYALGEGGPEERAAVEAALRSDPDARAILDAIRTDRRRPPPLRPARPARWRLALPLGALALAGALVSVGLPRGGPGDKGGALALELLRVRDGVTTASPETVAVGERLGLRLTCPPGPADIDVVVYHGGTAAFPLPRTTVACGNAVPLPGGFSADAPGLLVACVAVDPPPRAVLAADRDAADVCVDVMVSQ
ncbi:MAG: hypothetical protein R3F59_26855 [Myxococcota bacterium]